MIDQQARVVTSDGSRVRVEIGAQTGCPACDAGEGCGAGLFGRLLRRSPVKIEFEQDGRYRPGQLVTVGLPEAHFLKLVFVMYGIPLLAGLAGAAAGIAVSDYLGLVGGAADLLVLAGALLVAWQGLKLRNRTLKPWLSENRVQLLDQTMPGAVCKGAGFQANNEVKQ